MKCPITNREDMIDDCHIVIEFGYGSSKDCMTYTFSPVHDEVGQKVLEFIDSMIEAISNEVGLYKNRISIKATSNDGLGFIGRGEGISVITTSLIIKD